MTNIFFVAEYKKTNEDTFLAEMSSTIKTEEELFSDLKQKLQFPEYFGNNWNAVWDCLRDFWWIDKKQIIVYYDKLPGLDPYLLNNYLKLLIEATEDWKPGEAHCLHLVMPDEHRELIDHLLNSTTRSFQNNDGRKDAGK